MISSNFLKLLEYCLLSKFDKYLNLNSRQFGFRKNTSCLMATTILKETVAHYTNNGSNVYCTFVDLKKAFDRVNINFLLDKLITKKLPPLLISILKCMFDKQYVHVIFNNVRSHSWKIGNGVRQGGILSPSLFNFYINDILEALSELDVGCELALYRINLLGYADDIVLLSPSANGLQFLLDKFVHKATELCLAINEEKTVCMEFTCKKLRKFSITPKIFVNNVQLKVVHEYKYLGIIITNNLRCSSDIKKCNVAFLKQFYGIFRKFHFLDPHILKFLFHSHCTSFYGAELWADLKGSSGEFRALGVAYHKAIKKMFGLPFWESNHYTCDVAELQIFRHLINKRIVSFLFAITRSHSPCMLPLIDYFKSKSYILKHTQNVFRYIYNSKYTK